MGQSAKANTNGMIILTIGTNINNPSAQQYPALEKILQKMTAFMMSTIKARNVIKKMSVIVKTGPNSWKLSKVPVYSISFPFK
jgi:hypothetical protein